MGDVEIEIKILEHGKGLELPTYATSGSAGVDLRAAIDEDITLQSLERKLVPTGIAIALPPGYEAQIRPRSGLAIKKGISMVNAPGTIDSDYRGEISIILINMGSEAVSFTRGDRIAQMVIARVSLADWKQVDELDTTDRNSGGFGHSGVS